jgi:hypothetical protein
VKRLRVTTLAFVRLSNPGITGSLMEVFREISFQSSAESSFWIWMLGNLGGLKETLKKIGSVWVDLGIRGTTARCEDPLFREISKAMKNKQS